MQKQTVCRELNTRLATASQHPVCESSQGPLTERKADCATRAYYCGTSLAGTGPQLLCLVRQHPARGHRRHNKEFNLPWYPGRCIVSGRQSQQLPQSIHHRMDQ